MAKTIYGESKVFDFMEKVAMEDSIAQEELDFQNSPEYKDKCLNNGMHDAKCAYMHKLFHKMHQDAMPLSDDYKIANTDKLDSECDDFLGKKCDGKDIFMYVTDVAKSGNPIATRLVKAVEDVVNKDYEDRINNPENYTTGRMAFKSADVDVAALDNIASDLQIDDISQIISDNVKATAMSEIERAKKEKEARSDIEKQLASDININTNEAVEYALQLRGLKDERDFQPSLFEGMMLGYSNKYITMSESGDFQQVYLYGAADDYMSESVAAGAVSSFMARVKKVFAKKPSIPKSVGIEAMQDKANQEKMLKELEKRLEDFNEQEKAERERVKDANPQSFRMFEIAKETTKKAIDQTKAIIEADTKIIAAAGTAGYSHESVDDTDTTDSTIVEESSNSKYDAAMNVVKAIASKLESRMSKLNNYMSNWEKNGGLEDPSNPGHMVNLGLGMHESTDNNEIHYSLPEEVAFVEAVKEYTRVNMMKALKFDKYSLNDVRFLAQDYATM